LPNGFNGTIKVGVCNGIVVEVENLPGGYNWEAIQQDKYGNRIEE